MKNSIIFKQLSMKNFMSYGNSTTLVEFDKGMTLITGKNGDGKTSQFIALYYALFGKSYKTKLGSLINDINNKGMLVSITFSVNDINYKVIRGQKPNIFEIYKDNELINQNSTVTEYQEYLETNILQFNDNVFKQLIFLGANVRTSKSFIDLTKAEKEELFQTITDTAIFNDLKDSLKIKTKISITERTELDYKSKVLNELIASERNNIQKMEAQNKAILAQSDEYIKEIQDKIKTNAELIEKYNEGLEKIKLKKPIYDEKMVLKSTLNEELNSLQSNINNINIKLSKIESVENTFSTCIGCEKLGLISKIDITEKEMLLSELANKTLNLTKVKEDYNNICSEIDELTDIFSKGKQLKLNRDTKIQDNESYNIELNNIQARKQQHVVIDTSILESKEEELVQVNTSLIQVKELINKYERLNKLFDNNNIKGLIIKQSLPLLNKYINEYLDNFSDFAFKFNVDSNFVSSIRYRNKDYEFSSLSNGQSMRISFSIILAFLKLIETKNGVTTNLLILDEILDSSLDYDGRIELLDIIQREFSNKSVYVISHNNDIINTEHFNKTLRVYREDGFSKIKESE